jgi:hypothetical protein
MSLAQADWVAAHHNLLVTGPARAGKTFLACALTRAPSDVATPRCTCGHLDRWPSWCSVAAMGATSVVLCSWPIGVLLLDDFLLAPPNRFSDISVGWRLTARCPLLSVLAWRFYKAWLGRVIMLAMCRAWTKLRPPVHGAPIGDTRTQSCSTSCSASNARNSRVAQSKLVRPRMGQMRDFT